MAVRIPHLYEPRDYQLPLLSAMDGGCKRAIWIAHRRAGKDLTCLSWQIKEAIQHVSVNYYLFPTYTQGKKAMWKGLDNEGIPFIDRFPPQIVRKKNQSDLTIELRNGSLWQVVGTDSLANLRGPNPRTLVFSEFSFHGLDVWDTFRPILRGNGGKAIFNSTPNGRNHAWDMLEMAKDNPNWFVETLTVEDTGVVTPEDIAEDRAEGMSERLVQQEYYCAFNSGVDGAYWKQEWIDQYRVWDEKQLNRSKVYFDRIELFVDPATSKELAKEVKQKNKKRSETGMAVVAHGKDGNCYILASDGSTKEPAEWGEQVIKMAVKHNVSVIRYEPNQGGEAMKYVLLSCAAKLGVNIPVLELPATRVGKNELFEPVSVYYQNGKVRHVGRFPILEDQATTFPVAHTRSDRLNAVVLGVHRFLKPGGRAMSQVVKPRGYT